MKILFLHGWTSTPGGLKPKYLQNHGQQVLNPALSDEDFAAAVQVAQAEFHRHGPDVVVGSSRGGSVAMNIDSGDTPLVLLCPAWKRWGQVTTVKANTTVLHSRADKVIPFADSEELIRNSRLRESALIEVGLGCLLRSQHAREPRIQEHDRASRHDTRVGASCCLLRDCRVVALS